MQAIPAIANQATAFGHVRAPHEGMFGATALLSKLAVADTGRAMTLSKVYREHGGLVNGDALAALLRVSSDQPISTVARWIVRREIVCFAFRAQTLVPLFQFNLGSASLRTDVQKVVAELIGAFDDTEVAEWFATPNQWLGAMSPLEAPTTSCDAVFAAARADRFAALG